MRLVQIQTTSVCNARCSMCPYSESWYKENPGRMSDELFQKIIREVKDIDPLYDQTICPYLCNEPFADPNILDKIEYIRQQLPNALIEISTNCELLTPKKVDKLLEIIGNSKAKIVISHHGIDKNTLEKTMKIDYDKAVNNIIYLIKANKGKVPIAIQNMAVSKDHTHRLIQPIKIRRYLDKMFDENNMSWDNVRLSTLEFHNRAGNVKMDNWNYDRIVRQIDKDHKFDCYRASKDCLHVLYNGEVILCCMDYHRETVIGDLNTQSIKEMFDSKKCIDMFSMVKGDKESPEDFICKRCQSPGG